MEKVFHFDSPSEGYAADALVLCCFDERIRLAVNKFLQRQGIRHPDMIIVAGGAKTLASPESDSERDYILNLVRKSIHLHMTKRLFLVTHSDCGTYGGLAAFKRDQAAEMSHHQKELQRAAEVVLATFPELKVECFFVNFDGVYAAK